jgi:hypothetical protein
MEAMITVWYLLITPLPGDTAVSPAPQQFRTFEVENVDFANIDDCKTYAAQHGQDRLNEKYSTVPTTDIHAVPTTAIIGAMQCFSRQRKAR